jgi:hypothetical protein
MGGVSPLTSNVGSPSNTGAAVKTMYVDFDYANYPNFDKDANNDGTLDSFTGQTPAIPARSIITRCFLQIKDEVTGGTATGIDIGLYVKAGTAIDADGLFTAAGGGVLSGLTAGAVIVGAGALATNDSVGADDAYIKFLPNGTLTAGSGRIVVEYIPPKA